MRSLFKFDSEFSDHFISQTIYDIARDCKRSKRDGSDVIKSLREKTRATCCHTSDLVKAISELASRAHNAQNVPYRQILSLARFLGCAKNKNFEENGIYATHEAREYILTEDLLAAIEGWWREEFVKVEKLREDLEAEGTAKNIKYTVFRFVLEKDSAGLSEFLAQLKPRSKSNGGGGKCNCATVCIPSWEMPTLDDVLCCTDVRGWTSLQWASELGASECISVLLENAKRGNEQLFLDVLEVREKLTHAPALYMSVFKADVDCIMAFLHAGVDFTTTCGAAHITVLEYLVHLASSGKLTSVYLPILEVVLKHVLEKNPNFDLTAPITFDYEKETKQDGAVLAAAPESESESDAEEEVGAAGEEGGVAAVEEDEVALNADEDNNETPVAPRPRPLHRDLFHDDYDYDYDYYYNRPNDQTYIPGFAGKSQGCISDEQMSFGWISQERKDSIMFIDRHQLVDEEKWKDASWTLLSIAARERAVDVVKLLLDAGANPNYLLPSGKPVALLWVAMDIKHEDFRDMGGLATLTLLLNAGANINAVTNITKSTAMMRAVKHGAMAAIVVMVKAGADLTMRDSSGKSAKDIAYIYYPELVELFTRKSRLKRLVEKVNNDDNNNNDNDEEGNDTTVPEHLQCGICWNNERTITLAPCGHKKLCTGCALKILSRVEKDRKCPFCMTVIESYIMQIYD